MRVSWRDGAFALGGAAFGLGAIGVLGTILNPSHYEGRFEVGQACTIETHGSQRARIELLPGTLVDMWALSTPQVGLRFTLNREQWNLLDPKPVEGSVVETVMPATMSCLTATPRPKTE